ncbi:NAD(P)-dependent oxidoreductase [Sinomonas cellulolyticus]|uniref:NAD(P)-dependent oxidoreductase n=1 Tax=Sinomonas cellulolyticus TaxID=2801916 RepID=UPI002105DB92|nr:MULTISPECIES: NAD(P)-dependent oxidoreductase [Sinomonas]
MSKERMHMSVGYIGLGRMGGNMALRLLECGVDLVVTDVSKDQAGAVLEAGARWVDTAAEVAAEADVILTSLPGPPQVEQVAAGPGGLLEGMRPGSAWVDMSTSSPVLIRALAQRFAEKGVDVIDAPVSGGPQHCRAGELVIFVGAEDEQLARVEPVLQHLATEILHIGALGAGAVAKLVNNATALGTWSLLSEVFSLGVKAGVDHQTLHGMLSKGAYGRGLILSQMLPGVAFKHNFDPAGFALNLGRKDIALANALGRDLNVPLPVLNLVEQSAVEMVGRGHGDKDTAVVFSLQEERAGVVMHDGDAKEFTL